MALSGSCSTGTWYGDSASGSLVFNWSATQDQAKNQSTISWNIKGSVSSGYIVYSELSVKINGSSVYYRSSSNHTNTYNGTQLASGTKTLTHNADGTCSFSVEIGAGIYNWTINKTGSGTFTLNPHTVYSLSVSAGTGSTITVNRTSSGYASTGNLSNGARLYKGDTLKITFAASTNYAIATHTVNGSTFTSGGTHTVSANVSIVSTATLVKSTIGATDANIGSTSTITITRYNSSYTHTVTYKFGSATGTVVTKGTSTSISWTVPTTFYAQIPNAKTGTCTLTCETFSGSTSLGTNTCTLTVTASSASSAPTVSGTVVDTNTTTVALTGNSATLVRYKSTAKCTITATANNSASISAKYINDVAPTNDVRTFSGVSTTSFVFKATDSRGYTSTKTVTPTMIAYVNLTCNPIISRVTPTGSEAVMTLSGNYYRGSFGSYSNTLTIRYRYRESTTSTWGSWTTVPSTSYTIGTNTYSTSSAISLGDGFDYRKSYVFQVQAYDGANGTTLTTVTKEITLQRGIPVFDWGENDFNFHVPIKIGDTQLTEAQLIQLLALIT